jgi:hypothetical protein
MYDDNCYMASTSGPHYATKTSAGNYSILECSGTTRSPGYVDLVTDGYLQAHPRKYFMTKEGFMVAYFPSYTDPGNLCEGHIVGQDWAMCPITNISSRDYLSTPYYLSCIYTGE